MLQFYNLIFTGFPGVFTAIKCGTSGHNVRVAPSLDSTAIGMVVVGNQLTATREVNLFNSCVVVLSKLFTNFYKVNNAVYLQ